MCGGSGRAGPNRRPEKEPSPWRITRRMFGKWQGDRARATEREGRELMGKGPLFIAAPTLDVSPSQAAVKLTALKRKRVG